MNNNQTAYQLIGEIEGTRRLANAFYDIMETDPALSALLAIHPLPLDSVREKFYLFLSGWLGGPDLFVQQYGHPRLRMRHLPFTVTPALKIQWMMCMDKAMQRTIDNQDLIQTLHHAFDGLAEHMINSPDPVCPSHKRS